MRQPSEYNVWRRCVNVGENVAAPLTITGLEGFLMFYEKKIGYLEYRENGEKVHNAGFVKIEVKNDCCNLQVQVSRFPVLDKLTRKILIQSGKKETYLGEITLQEGGGSFRMRGEDAANLGQSGIRYDELAKIVIVIGTGRELVCNWGKETLKGESPQGESPQEESPQEELPQEEPQRELSGRTEGWKLPQETGRLEAEQMQEGGRKEEERVPGKTEKENRDGEKVPGETEEKNRNGEKVPGKTEERTDGNPSDRKACRSPRRLQLYEDKWKQLSSIYPHITPFYDEREYLSITPADFVVLHRQYHKLVSNSFLLHGFYNYNHLILARVERAGAIRYYVGVPGNFYEKERQIAIMFGFESFECRKEPVGQGDFGYYCIRVDL